VAVCPVPENQRVIKTSKDKILFMVRKFENMVKHE
jgi:hypothetical protein